MQSYIVLFRAVNVGGNNRLPMAELKLLLKAEGLSSVQTYIQSGNVVLLCDNNPLELVTQVVAQNFGFDVQALCLNSRDFQQAIALNPYVKHSPKAVHFYFCQSAPNADLAALEAMSSESEEFKLVDQVLYLHAPNGIGRSKLVSQLQSKLGVSVTGRNMNTVNKLSEMLKSITVS